MVAELKLPNNYRLIEEEEMLYTEGGWDWDTAFNNVKGLASRYSYANNAIRWALGGRSVYSLTLGAFIASWGSVSSVVYTIAASIPGVGWAGIGASLGAASYALGQWRMFY